MPQLLFLFLLLTSIGNLFGERPKEEPKICLTMIVKNESKIIERCLDSVKDIVDCISICDTGSSDNTVEIIEQYLSDHHIPGEVHHDVWLNFGHNRTLSAKAAQKTLRELNFSLPNTYLLLLDADMIFEITPEFKKEQLTKDFYSLVQKSLQMSYYNVRLIRASLPCECVGVTHEYWSCGNNARGDKLTTLWIDDREDGGSKADKFERDVRLLTQGLEKEPDNVRYMFYLAQSYKCLKQYDEAIKWYSKRIENGGWKEEIWYAKLMIGEMHGLMDDWEKALSYYLDAYQFNPERAESLERIALYYRLKEQYDLAYLFATHGAKIPYPKNQQLFITDTVYTYRFDEELSIAAFYTPFKKEGLAAEDRLLRNSSVPSHVKKQALKNLHFYVENLPNVHFEQFPKETSLRTTPATGNPIIKIPVNQNTPTENPENDFSVFTIVAGPVPFENGYLAVAQHASCDENPYCFHRFLYLDKKQNIISMTDPFIYQHKGIEVCNDLNIDQKNASIQMSVTIENEEPKLASIDIKTIKSLLK